MEIVTINDTIGKKRLRERKGRAQERQLRCPRPPHPVGRAFHEPTLVWSPAFRLLRGARPAEAGTPCDRKFMVPMHARSERGLSMNLVAATAKWRQILPFIEQPPRHRGGFNSLVLPPTPRAGIGLCDWRRSMRCLPAFPPRQRDRPRRRPRGRGQ